MVGGIESVPFLLRRLDELGEKNFLNNSLILNKPFCLIADRPSLQLSDSSLL